MSYFDQMPRVRLTIEHMKHEIIHVINARHTEMEQRIAEEIDRAIAAFDFEREVRTVADAAIRKAVGDAVNNLIGWEFREQIEAQVRQEVRDRINKK